MENGAKDNAAETPCLLQQRGQIGVRAIRVGLKLLSQRSQTNISTPAPLILLRSACDGPGVRKPLKFISPISGSPKRRCGVNSVR